MDFNKELANKVDEINKIIQRFLPEETGYQKTMIQAMNYSVNGNGKRLRPLIMAETYKLFGGEGLVVEPFMVAMEMIHSYSLVHDDLPAIDNDDYRRGRKTTHKVFGEDIAIFAADALQTYAYEVALHAFDIEPDNKGIVRALKILTHNSGIYGMAGGEGVDIELTGKQIDLPTLDFIHRLKTAALIEASMSIGAVLAGAGSEDIGKIKKAGELIGVAFQIQDDILDVVGDEAVIGKPILSDERNEKTTYVTIHGLDKARTIQADMSKEAMDLLDSLDVRNDFLIALINKLINRER